MNCRVCGRATRFAFSQRGYRILECPHCLHRMAGIQSIEVGQLYSDDYFFGGKGEYADYLAEKSLLVGRGAYYSDVVSRFIEKPGKMLDIGSAAGFLLKGFVDGGWQGTGVEPNEKMADYGRIHLGLKIYSGTIESFASRCQEEKYDLISLIQVIAHFLDPERALRSCAGLLCSGGYLLIETWDWRSMTAKLFGRRWHEYNPPYVLQFFSRTSLGYLMSKVGFRRCAEGRPNRRILGQHAKFLIQKKLAAQSRIQTIGKLTDPPAPSQTPASGLSKKGSQHGRIENLTLPEDLQGFPWRRWLPGAHH